MKVLASPLLLLNWWYLFGPKCLLLAYYWYQPSTTLISLVFCILVLCDLYRTTVLNLSLVVEVLILVEKESPVEFPRKTSEFIRTYRRFHLHINEDSRCCWAFGLWLSKSTRKSRDIYSLISINLTSGAKISLNQEVFERYVRLLGEH